MQTEDENSYTQGKTTEGKVTLQLLLSDSSTDHRQIFINFIRNVVVVTKNVVSVYFTEVIISII